jgi:hypothetical protein
MPKAGTHLLSSLLSALPRMMFSGIHHALNEFSVSPGIAPEQIPEVDMSAVTRELARVRKGQFMTAHFPAAPGLPKALKQSGFKTVLILRDPRDVAVSHTAYVTSNERHFLHDRYSNALSNESERLMATITGFPKDEHGPAQESIGARVAKYAPWLDEDAAYVCRFEDLVGLQGGGSERTQRETVAGVARHIDRPLSAEELRRAAERTWSASSATFRKGTIGQWVEHFSTEHKEAFKKVAGDALVTLGYENDLDW